MAQQGWDRFDEATTLGICGPDCVARLSAHWRESDYRAGATIVAVDDTDDNVFFVLSGKARAASFTHSGKEIRFSDMMPGESFGIFAAIDGLPRSTNVIAAEDARIARLSGAQFREILDQDRDIRDAILLYLVARVRALSNQITRLTAMSAEQRLVSELLAMASPDGTEPNRATISPRPTHQELAIRILGQREAVTRDLKQLRIAGLIENAPDALVICDVDGLRRRLPP